MENNFIFVGEVVEKSKKIKHGQGKNLINLMVAVTQEVYGGIIDEVEKRVVMFQNAANKAHTEISRGDYVLFSQCRRSPRAYTTTKGTYVEDINIIANRFTILTAEQYEANKDAFAADMPSVSDLTFKPEDKIELEKKAKKAEEIKLAMETAGAVI